MKQSGCYFYTNNVLKIKHRFHKQLVSFSKGKKKPLKWVDRNNLHFIEMFRYFFCCIIAYINFVRILYV